MIVRTIVDGRPAAVAYTKKDSTPCSKEQAELVRVHWDDGDTALLVPSKSVYKTVLKGNPCHKPAGSPDGGQFCSVGFEQKILNSLTKRYPHLSKVKVEMFDVSVYWDDLLATKSSTKLLLNPKKWNDDSFWESRAKEWDGLVSDTSKEGTVLHEIGHILDGLVLNKLGSKKYNALLEKHVPGGALYGDSTTPYGQENIFEMLAEAFVIREKKIMLSGMPKHIQESILKKSTEIWDDFDRVLRS